jgi:hypothetical protein
MKDRTVKRYSVCVGSTCGRGKMNERDEDEGMWLMNFIYLHEIEQRNFLQ